MGGTSRLFQGGSGFSAQQDPVAAAMRRFDTGATRSSDTGKPDYEGFLSPLVIEGFGAYMLKHQTQADGQIRASDNWQKGIPQAAYIKSLWRHFMAVWKLWRSDKVDDEAMRENVYAMFFNVQGFAHEFEKGVLHRESLKASLNDYTDLGWKGTMDGSAPGQSPQITE